MMNGLVYYVPALILLLLFLSATIKILREYERGVVFTLGRFTGVKGPGLILLIPLIQQMVRSEEHTSELQSLMRISYAVFCLKKKRATIDRLTDLSRTLAVGDGTRPVTATMTTQLTPTK